MVPWESVSSIPDKKVIARHVNVPFRGVTKFPPELTPMKLAFGKKPGSATAVEAASAVIALRNYPRTRG
jgi:hypothetical protein